MEFKGTKGKWWSCCIKTTPHYIFTAEGETTICGFYKKQEMRDDLPDEELRANALLISKAPEILEMLKQIAKSEMTTPNVARNICKLIKEATEL